MSNDEHPAPEAILRQLLLEARLSSGMKQAELARRLKKPQSFVSKVETGERQIDVLEFADYVKAIGLHPVGTFADLVMALRNTQMRRS